LLYLLLKGGAVKGKIAAQDLSFLFSILKSILSTQYRPSMLIDNRSALESVIDRYRVHTDPQSGIVNDHNRPDDEKYVVRRLGKVVTVSLEAAKIVQGLDRKIR